jgi:simple sugar transport system ATP-binding protein
MSPPPNNTSPDSAAGNGGYVVEISDVTKRFPRVIANHRVTLKVKTGEIHALVGENGAGKTTLMNVLYGMLRPDSGQVLVRSNRLPAGRGYLGLDYGIGMIHQHFMLIGRFTALENIILGSEPASGIFLDLRTARRRVERIMSDYGIEVDLDALVDDLSVGEEQRVEILKVLYRNAEIIIMDEPTAVLTPQETAALFATLRRLTADGRTVIFITHKLEEVMAVSDAVTVMRGGRVVGSRATSEIDVGRLAEMMVGRKMDESIEREPSVRDEVVLAVEDVSLSSAKGQRLLDGISFSIRRGEIFGICGVDGNGQDELFEVLTGLAKPDAGKLEFLGSDIGALSAMERSEAGLAHIPASRIRMGLVGEFDIEENLILGRHREPRFSGAFFIRRAAVVENAKRLISEFGIEPPVPSMQAGVLSGGNQQKVVVARELSRDPDLLIASQPTRGLDIGAAHMIHDLLVQHVGRGRAVLLISADLAEVMKLSDRIGVMYRGRIVGVVDGTGASEEELGLMMAGVER